VIGAYPSIWRSQRINPQRGEVDLKKEGERWERVKAES